MAQRAVAMFLNLIIVALLCLLLAEAQEIMPAVDADVRAELQVMADIVGEMING